MITYSKPLKSKINFKSAYLKYVNMSDNDKLNPILESL